VAIEICVKYPGGPTRIKVTGMLSACLGILPQGIVYVTAAAIACNGYRLRCRSCSVTAAASAAARFLFVPSELPPLWVPALRPALFCGPLLLSILNYRIANCPRIAAPFYVGVECPAALFYISTQPKPSIFGWLFITHLLLAINGELGQFAVRPEPPTFYMAALPLLSLPYLTSIIDIYVLRALYRIRAQLPVRHLQQCL
jgi:hypothetical protein